TVLADHKVVFTYMNTSKVGLFTAEGTLHQLKVLDLPLCKPKDKGVPLDNICNLDSSKETVVAVIPLDPAAKDQNYIFVTKMGLIKRVPLEEFFSVKKTIAATKLADGDAVVAVLPEIKRHIILITDDKMYLRYQVSDVPLQKKTAAGVRGVKLARDQHVKSAYLLNPHEVSMISIDEDFFDITETKLKKRESGRLEKL
ncbi:MAG: DNA topoisomerase, partial [Lachnospiraceae bacterium]|nr:DNA topoisomerase [Lachnospiraceae bacterium]